MVCFFCCQSSVSAFFNFRDEKIPEEFYRLTDFRDCMAAQNTDSDHSSVDEDDDIDSDDERFKVDNSEVNYLSSEHVACNNIALMASSCSFK